tara:strand:- start:214 stop:339 length:126 start_codon:yes stop_codon:yes gene_type:complete
MGIAVTAPHSSTHLLLARLSTPMILASANSCDNLKAVGQPT